MADKGPVTIIQYKYHDEEFGKILSGAFSEFTSSEQKLTIYTRDKPISLNREPLVVFSTFLRSILDSLPCCAKPSILLPDCSSSALEHLLNIVLHGVTDFQGELNTSEILVAAKSLAIDITNFDYVKTQNSSTKVKGRGKELKPQQTRLPIHNDGLSDSDLDETVVDEYGEEMDEVENRYAETSLNTYTQDKKKSKMFDKEEQDVSETLDEKPEDGSNTSQECVREPTSNTGSNKTVSKKGKKLSVNSDTKPSKYTKKKTEHNEVNQQALLMSQRAPIPNQTLSGIRNPPPPQYAMRHPIPPQRWEATLPKPGQTPSAYQESISNKTVPMSNSNFPQQHWAPVLPTPTVPNQPFRHPGPQPSRAQYQGQMRPQLDQFNHSIPDSVSSRLPTPRYAPSLESSSYAGHQLPLTPRPQTQPMGLWAQSAGQSTRQNHPMMQPPVNNGDDQFSRTDPNQQIALTSNVPPTTTCQLCNKTMNNNAQLWQHYARNHFLAELKAEYGSMADIQNKICRECGSVSKSVDILFIHIGTVHRKVNEIMEKRGLVSLKMPGVRSRKSM